MAKKIDEKENLQLGEVKSICEDIRNLIAALLVQGKTKKEQIYLLGKLDLSRSLIAKIVETSPLTVSVTLSSKPKNKKMKEVAENV